MSGEGDMLAAIAREHLGLETLDARNMDSLDFHEHGVWCIKDALEAAFRAGAESAREGQRAADAGGAE